MSEAEKAQSVTNILIGCTGSVASIKLLDIIQHLQSLSYPVSLVLIRKEL